MRTTVLTIAMASLTCLAAAADTSAVELNVAGILPGPSSGTVYVSLCSEAEFMKGPCALKARAKADAASLSLKIESVPPGRYAASAWWDFNDNGEMELGSYGEPLEPVAISNDAVGVMGPPSFADAAFDVPVTVPVALTFK